MNSQVKNCPFCHREKLKNQIFWENNQFFALLVNRPKTKHHFAISPKKHQEKINLKIVNLLVKNGLFLAKKMKLKSFIVKMNVNVWRLQKHPSHVKHLHLHIIPVGRKPLEAPPKLKSNSILREEMIKLKQIFN